MKRTQIELDNKLKEQIYLLKKSCQDFDNGDHLEALRIATSLRTILHDTKGSASLLFQLGIKDKIQWYNTKLPTEGPVGWHIAPNYKKEGILSLLPNIVVSNDFIYPDIYLGLVIKKVTIDSDGILLSFASIGRYDFNKRVNFSTWWEDKIFDNRNGVEMSRKQTVLFVANKEGGAHIDDLPDNFFNFKSKEVIQLRFKKLSDQDNSNPIYPTIRQIAFEVLESLQSVLPLV